MKTLLSTFSAFCVAFALNGCAEQPAATPAPATTEEHTHDEAAAPAADAAAPAADAAPAAEAPAADAAAPAAEAPAAN